MYSILKKIANRDTSAGTLPPSGDVRASRSLPTRIPVPVDSGFGLIESLVSVAIFTMLSLAVFSLSSAILKQARTYRESTTVSALADQYMEIARNLPYSSIGTISGNPHGALPDQPNAKVVSYNGNNYQIYYEVTYVDDPADGTAASSTDFASNDYKQVKLSVVNMSSGVSKLFVTNISPQGLENLSSGGALSLKVFDAVGQPIAGATIHITSVGITPAIDLTRTSDASGNWIEVGLPNKANGYHIVVTKSGYSTDQTYPITGGNSNPTKPDATVANGTVTQVSFAIDLLSNLNFNVYNQNCQPISGAGVEVRGAKLIGTPSVYKFDNTYTSSGAGLIPLSNIEWDNYTPSVIGNTYMIYGSSPIQQVSVLPNTSQLFTLILGSYTANSLLVVVKDSSTSNPIEGATVTLKLNNPAYSSTLQTAGSIWSEQSWAGGSGQAAWSDTTKYWSGSGVSTTDLPLAVRLQNSGGRTLTNSGSLVSSTYDTGTASTTYTTFSWLPTSQSASSTLKFQLAANNDNATWNFTGPDGTANTYYATPGTAISTSLNNNRYIRYQAYLSTTDTTKNPTLTSTSLNYVSGCFSPGQAIFPSLSSANTYQLTVSMPGYVTKTITGITVSGYSQSNVSLVAQ